MRRLLPVLVGSLLLLLPHLARALEAPPNYVREWGGYGSGPGQFINPAYIAVDPSDFVYVADSGNNRIQKFTSDGVFVTAWGTAGSTALRHPVGVAYSPLGEIIVTTSGDDRVERFSLDGAFLGASSHYSSSLDFNSPHGVGCDPMGRVFVADRLKSRVQRMSPALIPTAVMANQPPFVPNGIGCDAMGRFWVTYPPTVDLYDGEGNHLQSFNWNLTGAEGICVDRAGNLLITPEAAR